jgi:hypothetical protein
MKRAVLLLIFTLSALSAISGLELWPFLNYAMFACSSRDELILPSRAQEGDPFEPILGTSYSLIDGFSAGETVYNLHARGKNAERDRFISALRSKLGADVSFYLVRIQKDPSGRLMSYTPLEKLP